MEHLDEKLQEIRNQQKQLENQDIRGKVNVGGTLYEIEEFTFFDAKMAIRLPKEFTDMPINFAKLKYPSEQRPQIIKMNEDGSVNFTFSLYPDKLKEEEIEDCIRTLKAAIERMNPAHLFFELQVLEQDELKVGYFDYKSNALDSDLYNILYVTPIGGRIMMGAFNCRLGEREAWKPVVLKIAMSIKDLTQSFKGGPKHA
jgi:hypothetical protein